MLHLAQNQELLNSEIISLIKWDFESLPWWIFSGGRSESTEDLPAQY